MVYQSDAYDIPVPPGTQLPAAGNGRALPPPGALVPNLIMANGFEAVNIMKECLPKRNDMVPRQAQPGGLGLMRDFHGKAVKGISLSIEIGPIALALTPFGPERPPGWVR